MANKAREQMERRAQKAIVQHAFIRWESAVIIGLTMLLTVLATVLAALPLTVDLGPWWVWLLAGIVAEAMLVYSSLSDDAANKQVVAEMLRSEFQPGRIKTPELRRQVEEAFNYRSRIATAIQEQPDTVLRDELIQTASQLDDWLEELYYLAQRLDRYGSERELYQKNRARAVERLQQLQAQLRTEDSPAVKTDIEVNISSKRRQLETIDQLDNAMEQARLRLENTLTAMSTIHAQMTLLGAKDIDSGRAQRLRQDIAEEVNELTDILAAMDEVYTTNGTT